MKLTLHSFKSDVPQEKVCRPGVEYQVFESDMGPDEAFGFLDRLVYTRDSFQLEAPEYLLECWICEDAIWVEITGAEFWGTSGVSREEAKAIIEALERGEGFCGRIPLTGREWDAYSMPEGEGLAGHGAV